MYAEEIKRIRIGSKAKTKLDNTNLGKGDAKRVDTPLILLIHHYGEMAGEEWERNEVQERLDESGRPQRVRCSKATWSRAADAANHIGMSGANREDALTFLALEYATDLRELYEDAEPEAELKDAKKLREAWREWRAYNKHLDENPPPKYLKESAIKEEPDYTDVSLSVEVANE
ncbi:hypothetical protein ACFQJD_18645 [Haloplanus sp. GCM10025708]|uniref:hypothetical protein n=1 Tax=Haloferacaceae TaxID=1644056 RepID=UPI00361BAE89